MPPYSAQDSMMVESRHQDDAHADVAPTKLEEIVAPESSTENGDEEKSSIFDFNLCTGVSGAGASMQSAMFKTRMCAECGQSCNKIVGYNKEVVEKIIENEETGESVLSETKIHFHKWCSQIKEWRQIHSEQYRHVMESLSAHFYEKALAKQRMREAEEATRREALARARDEAQRQQEEDQRMQEKEQALAEKESRKQRGFFARMRNAFSNGCRSKKAVDETATTETADAAN